PDRDITVINLGLSSETVSGITEPVHPFPRPNVFYRLETALRISRPNWVVACYGMNDGIYRPVNDEIKDKFRGGIQQLVDRCEAFGARVILATPPFFDAQAPRAQKGMRDLKDTEPYGFRRVYEAYNDETLVPLSGITKSFCSHPAVDRVVPMNQWMKQYVANAKEVNPKYTYGDGVHPPQDGQFAIAVGMLQAMGCDGQDVQNVVWKHLEMRLVQPSANQPTGDADPGAAGMRKRVLGRARSLNNAYREVVGTAHPRKFSKQPIDEAIFAAKKEELEIRQAIAAK
ncbi:MAG: hypothetical protein AAFP69_20480, partial [Planctomycetota bacterium]